MNQKVDKPKTKANASRRPTIRDVARTAGVSLGTVSNALNRPEYIHPDTLAKVRKAIVHLGFSPSPGARSRRRKTSESTPFATSEVIGILLLGTRDLQTILREFPIYAYAIHGAEQSATQQGWPCQIMQARDFEHLVRIHSDIPRGGLILLAGEDAPHLPENVSWPPVVKVMGLANTRWGDCCTYSSYGSGRVAAEYLRKIGCTVGACLSNGEPGVPGLRLQGFSDTFAALGGTVLPPPSQNLFASGHNPSDAAILEVIRSYVQSTPKLNGLFISADLLARPAYRAFEELGIVPGRDLEVVTCNNERPYLADLDPQPAVVDIHGELIGAEAVKLLLWRKAHPHEPRRTLMIEPTLVPKNR